MENNKIDVIQAVEGERANYISSYQYFEDALGKNNIKVEDIFPEIKNDPNRRVKIKRDLTLDNTGGARYIFNIDGENKFSISEANIEKFLREYCKKKETLKMEEDINIEAEGLFIEYQKSETKEDLDILKRTVLGKEKNEEEAKDPEAVKKKLARNIASLEIEKNTAQKNMNLVHTDNIERNLRKAHIAQIDDRIHRLERMKENIEIVERNQDKKYTINREAANGKHETREIIMNDINGYKLEQVLTQISVRIEETANEQNDIQQTGLSISNKEGDTVPYYEIIINDKSDARRLKKSLNKVNKQYVILDNLALDGAKKQLVAQDLQDLENYLNKVIDGPDVLKPSETPFVPTHAKEFYTLVKNDETLSGLLAYNKERTKISPNTAAESIPETSTGTTPETGTDTTPETGTNTAPKTTEDTRSFADKTYGETFKEGGIRGILRKTLNMFPNMKDSSKNTRTNLLVVGGVGFGVFKLLKRFFSGKWNKKQEKKTPFRQRLLIIGGVTLGFNAFGTNPIKFGEQFVGGGLDLKTIKLQMPRTKTETVDDPNKELTIAELNQIFGNATITQLKNSIDPKTFKLTDEGYQKLLLSFQGTDDESKAKREIIQKMRENKDKDILKTSFAKIGITPENIDNLSQDKTIQTYTGDTYNTKIEGADARDGVDDPKINITNQVENFNLTQEQKNKLIKYGNILYDERPTSTTQTVEFKEDSSNLYLKTYGERTRIDIEKLTIPGYTKENGNPIVFTGMKELMKATNLTNYLKSIFRGKAKGNKYNPFESSGVVGVATWDRNDIMFNDNDNSRYNPTHTEAIDGGRFGTIQTISPKIEENKSEYITYLNNLQIRNESQKTKDLAK